MLIFAIIILSLMLVISAITNIQYFRKNKEIVKLHLKEKNEWYEKQKNKNKLIDNYLESLKKRYQNEYESLMNKNKKGYIKGYYTEGNSGQKVETINYIILEDEYENGDIRVSLDYIEYVKTPFNEKDFTEWIFDTWVSLIENSKLYTVSWLESKDKLKNSRKEKIERLLEFLDEEQENYENNKKISKKK